MIAALFVLKDGPYANISDIEVWDKERDARKYDGPYPVIAHPPCERWGRYWSGGPSAKIKRKLGDDDGCFGSALISVRKFGGVLEHPEGSHAFRKHGLPIPDRNGGWTGQDFWGGVSCCVAQGHYGHRAQKLTWLYLVGDPTGIEIKWGLAQGMQRMDLGYHSIEARRRAIRTGSCQRLSKRQRMLTPEPFRDLLIKLCLGT